MTKTNSELLAEAENLEPSRLGKRLELPKYTGMRSVYPRFENHQLIAFLTLAHGYGKCWRLCPLKAAYETDKIQFLGMKPDFANSVLLPMKEAALSETLDRAVFKTREEVLAEDLQRKTDLRKTAEAVLLKMTTSQDARFNELAAVETVLKDALDIETRTWLETLRTRMMAEMEAGAKLIVSHREYIRGLPR